MTCHQTSIRANSSPVCGGDVVGLDKAQRGPARPAMPPILVGFGPRCNTPVLAKRPLHTGRVATNSDRSGRTIDLRAKAR
jgi:hypothetical protein